MEQSPGSHAGPHARTLARGSWQEIALTLPRAAMPTMQMLGEHAGLPADGQVIRADVFGPPAALSLRCPTIWVCPLNGMRPLGSPADHLGGIYLQMALGASVTPVRLDGRMVGSVIETPEAVEFVGAGIGPADASATAPEQARQTYERMEQALALAGMDFSHVVRTWLFLDEIHAWYADFNAVRTGFFTERGVFDGLVPASTGIGAPNPHGWAIMTGLLAVKPKTDAVRAQAVPSPLQCPALQYGSSFSRAVEVQMADHRRLLISGTASINAEGKTVHLGDVAAQVAQTMDVLQAILDSRGMAWSDVTRATAYVLDPADAPVFAHHLAAHDLTDLPVITAHSAICREDLLFELELDAVRGA